MSLWYWERRVEVLEDAVADLEKLKDGWRSLSLHQMKCGFCGPHGACPEARLMVNRIKEITSEPERKLVQVVIDSPFKVRPLADGKDYLPVQKESEK